MNGLVIGVMTGTSIDAIDIALLQIKKNLPFKLVDFYSKKIPRKLKDEINSLTTPNITNIQTLANITNKFSREIADNINIFLKKNGHKSRIIVCGVHGQTIAHSPQQGFSLQICNPHLIAELTELRVVFDFRNRDIARGGQGAPLAPLFHSQIAPKDFQTVFVNIGGIANISIITNTSTRGFDVGPGNCLLDLWTKKNMNRAFDLNGNWARTGSVNSQLLRVFQSDVFFKKKFPKSTSTQYFSSEWLEGKLGKFKPEVLPSRDIQATLTELTATAISKSIPKSCKKIYICGGGFKNSYLIERIKVNTKKTVESTKSIGWDPMCIESCCFGWLALQTYLGNKLDLRKITGSRHVGVSGAITA